MCCSTSSEGARVYLESDKVRFSESENILVTYYVNSEEDIPILVIHKPVLT